MLSACGDYLCHESLFDVFEVELVVPDSHALVKQVCKSDPAMLRV